MANTIKIKRGLSSDIDNVTLAQGELAITTDTNELYVGTESGKAKLNESSLKNIVDGKADGSIRSINAYDYSDSLLGKHAQAFGSYTTASGENSHAEGYGTKALGERSHAEGSNTEASGNYSHAEGYYTIASGEKQHVQGKNNIADTTSAHIVGNGAAEDSKSNAHTLDWSGNAWFAGDVYIGSTSGTNKDDGSKKLATEEFVATQIENSIPISDTPPENPSNGDLWIDTSEDGFLAEVDNTVSTTSENAVSNKAITTYANFIDAKISRLIDYSMDEVVIGKWTDNKNIYRQIISIDPSTIVSGIQHVSHNITGIKNVIDYYGIYKKGNEFRKFPTTFFAYLREWSGNLYISTEYIALELGDNVAADMQQADSIIVVIEYTT